MISRIIFMRRLFYSLLITVLISSNSIHSYEPPHSCSTFMLSTNDGFYVGHNLDEYRSSVPGMVTINKRGISKNSVSWEQLNPLNNVNADTNKVYWVSKYGSITFNTSGLEFIDGGMNEKGLCVSEMSLWNTVWPQDNLPKIYHYQWLQYVLDNFSEVSEVIESLNILSISGHCQWHFFIADRKGNTAIIDFHEGKRNVYQDDSMPYDILCNATYISELEKIEQFQGFGGDMELGIQNKEIDNRFVWCASLIDKYKSFELSDPVDYAFNILHELDCGNNQWKLVYDITHGSMYFLTTVGRSLRYIDFNSFDFSCNSPQVALDINRDLEGDVSLEFKPFTEIENKIFIKKVLDSIPIDTTALGKDFKSILGKNLNESTKNFKCSK